MPPLIVILGETASGKSALALDLAQQIGGEIICADSRTIYTGMDIGTAKPSVAEQKLVRHHLLDVVEPNESFNVAQFKMLAVNAINDIVARGKIPLLVGGTGLYIESVLFDFQFRNEVDTALRAQYERLSVEELQLRINKLGYLMPENNKNKRYLIRTLETKGLKSERAELRMNTLVLGKHIERETLGQRIVERIDAMLDAGFVQECRQLVEQFGEDAPGLNAPGYKAFVPYLRGECSLEQARAQFVLNDLHLAKKQRTWFRRKIYQNVIQYVINREQAVDLVTTFLNK